MNASPPRDSRFDHGIVRTDPLTRTLENLVRAVAGDWRDAPPLAFDRPAFRPAGRFEELAWEVNGERTAWVDELWWRHPHAAVRHVPFTTHVVIAELGQQIQLTVRVCADGGEDALGGVLCAGEARTAWLSTLAHECQPVVPSRPSVYWTRWAGG
jgi:hypothetical protein